MVPPDDPEGPDWHLGWEVFLSALGCMPMNPTGRSGEGSLETTLRLGDVLAAGSFWRQALQSASTIAYLQKIVGIGCPVAAGGDMRRWLRRLPVFRDGDTLALGDLFVHDVFHGLAGGHVPYVTGAPKDPTVYQLLKCLGVATDISVASLLKCLKWARSRNIQDIGLAADVYAKLHHLGFEGPDNELLLLVPGRGYLHKDDCTWRPFQVGLLQRCCRLEALGEHYSRFGSEIQKPIREWVRESPESDAEELCDALLQVIICARADPAKPFRPLGRGSVQPEEAGEGLPDSAKHVVDKLASLCWEEEITKPVLRVHGIAAFNRFVEHRMIVIPTRSEDGPSCRLVSMGEAFWSVAPDLKDTPCAVWALEEHYSNTEAVKHFFTDVLKVRSILTLHDLHMMLDRPSSMSVQSTAESSNVQDGLDLRGLFSYQQPPSSAGSFHPEMAVNAALARARSFQGPEAGLEEDMGQLQAPPQSSGSTARRNWIRVTSLHGIPVFSVDGVELPALPALPPVQIDLLRRLYQLFGLHDSQLAFAYDQSGRRVCEQRLFLDVQRFPRAVQLSSNGMDAIVTFWTSEIASTIAHQGTGPAIDDRLLQVQTELVATVLPLALRDNRQSQQNFHNQWGENSFPAQQRQVAQRDFHSQQGFHAGQGHHGYQGPRGYHGYHGQHGYTSSWQEHSNGTSGSSSSAHQMQYNMQRSSQQHNMQYGLDESWD
eukprot:gnl/MRDRNA2_/MRDRNA2_56304_c0_seq1.p1 gnl/MRDRNA2_/MRDRNA2_56304_c0~~gnl/MRDRNA2_/MRDRNA2_56304_c0_seq1.p1  ORF type:complete len:783 (+),score=130.24 gnl/MRDRNA2_/MRDRNA2_56304_c0_seq1:212-2350(+)